jgi:hypothetical protein
MFEPTMAAAHVACTQNTETGTASPTQHDELVLLVPREYFVL